MKQESAAISYAINACRPLFDELDYGKSYPSIEPKHLASKRVLPDWDQDP